MIIDNMEYRKKVKLDPNTEYYFVEMGELNRLNGGASYPFPSLEAAERFAESHKIIAKQNYGIDRDIVIRFPDGTRKEVLL